MSGVRIGTGRRLLRTRRSAAFDAKTRIPLPDEIEVSETDPWLPIAEAISDGQNMKPEDLIRSIHVETRRIGDPDTVAKVAEALKKKPDTATLYRYLNSLRERPAAEPTT